MPQPPLNQELPLFQLRTGGRFFAREPHGIAPQAFSQSTPGVAKFTEWYCQSGGSNLNAGSDTNNAAKYTSVTGAWSTVTLQFTPADGSTPKGNVNVNDMVSLYNDAATVAACIARVTAVADGVNGAITVTTLAGTAPVTGAAVSLKCGGAWKGPNGAVGWPMTIDFSNAADSFGNPPRINFKNDATYSISALIGSPNAVQLWYQGYASTPGDGGQAVLDAGGADISLVTFGNITVVVADFIFQNNAAAGSHAILNSQGGVFLRCVFHDGGQSVSVLGGTTAATYFFACEFYKLGLANPSNVGLAINGAGGGAVCYNCYFHDFTVLPPVNTTGVIRDAGINPVINCVFDNIAGDAIFITDSANGSQRYHIGNSFSNIGGYCYNNAGAASNRRLFLFNNLYANVGGFLRNPPLGTSPNMQGYIFNTAGFGVKGQRILNQKGMIEVGSIVTAGNPFNAPNTGDFSLIAPEAMGAGWAPFMETASGKSGTVSFPDIGATQVSPLITQWRGGDFVLAEAYIGHSYDVSWGFTAPTTLSLLSGSLPPGLFLIQTGPATAGITGVPTTLGVYNFTLRATTGVAFGDSTFHITVLSDPDEGVGGAGGG